MYKLFLLLIVSFLTLSIRAQQPEQDCPGAFLELAALDTFTTYNSFGSLQELTYNQNTSCLMLGEESSNWIRFNVCQNDTLTFLITPGSATADFDWALYDITGKSCSDAVTSANELRCNYSAIPWATGLATGYLMTSVPSGGPEYCAPLYCYSGQQLILVVNNHAMDTTGYTLWFNGNVVPCAFNGVASHDLLPSIIISPNPTSGVLNFQNLPQGKNVILKIFDAAGRLLLKEEIIDASYTLPSSLIEGIYFARIEQDGKFLDNEKMVFIK